jgi:hypothetical protein
MLYYNIVVPIPTVKESIYFYINVQNDISVVSGNYYFCIVKIRHWLMLEKYRVN